MTVPSRNDAVLLDAVRSPMGKKNGSLSSLPAAELAAQVLQALGGPTQVDPALIDDGKMGCVTQVGEQGGNLGRLAALLAGFPVD